LSNPARPDPVAGAEAREGQQLHAMASAGAGLSAADGDLALYVHWPFCVSKCPYCDFNSHVRSGIDQSAWRDALLGDLAHEAALLPGRRLTSIFFGGGTPSLMDPATAAALIGQACRYWQPSGELEVTLEANPSSVEAARFADLAAAGVNRVSLGIQSLDDRALHFLGRAHGAAEGLAALEVAQQQFARVSFDLIYALPGQTAPEWEAMLGRALALGTGHLSLYQLTIEPGTRFAALHAAGKLETVEPELAADLYELAGELARGAGLPLYEISNHARPGEESRHNLTYWRYGDYAGVGPGAHGRRLGMRTVRHRKPENYLSALERNGHGMVEEAPLSPIEAADEALVMGLRLAEGIEPDAIARRFGLDRLLDAEAVQRLVASGHLEQEGTRLRCTPAGRLLLDTILGLIADPQLGSSTRSEKVVR
jgi:putative oxygen-independent coproporphyrinogen III oxidase